MKKTMLACLCGLLLVLSGCGINAARVAYINGWCFQENSGTNDYSLFFGFQDKDHQAMAAPAEGELRIVNNNGEEVYQGSFQVTETDFATYTSQISGEAYLAEVRIPAEKIQPGSSGEGTFYLTVHQGDVMEFDEVNGSAMYLPLLDIQVQTDALPQEVRVPDYMGRTQSRVQIQEVTSVFDKKMFSDLTITVSGVKTYDSGALMVCDMVPYKLYDSQGYVAESGDLFLSDLSTGDKFREEIKIYDAVPGEQYTLRFGK